MTKTELTAAVNERLTEQNTALAKLDDTNALKVKALHEEWKPDTDYTTGDRRRHGDALYRCRQSHTSQAIYPPDIVPALWEMIPEPGQGDTPDNPIPYSGNMALNKGKYYAQDGVTYRCTRDTGNPVYEPLKNLVGLYVEVVNE